MSKNIFKSFDISMIIIEEADERFKPVWKMNEDRLDNYKKCCEYVDKIIENNDGTPIIVAVNEVDRTVRISIKVPDLTVNKDESYFYDLLKETDKIKFYYGEDDNVCLDLVFPSLWKSHDE